MFRRIGRIFKPFVNVKRWIGWSDLKVSYQNFKGMTKIALNQDKAKLKRETFEQAVKRLELTEEQLHVRKLTFLRTALFYVLLAIGIFMYAVNLIISGVFLGTFISLVLVIIVLALAYREHFWYTQMQHRRLGLSFKEWASYTFGGAKK